MSYSNEPSVSALQKLGCLVTVSVPMAAFFLWVAQASECDEGGPDCELPTFLAIIDANPKAFAAASLAVFLVAAWWAKKQWD